MATPLDAEWESIAISCAAHEESMNGSQILSDANAGWWRPLFSLLLGRALRQRCGVRRHGIANEFLERRRVDLLPFANIDRTTHVPFEARVEEPLRVFDRSAPKERELDDLFVDLASAYATVVTTDGDARAGGLHPLPLFFDVGIGCEYQLAQMRERVAT